MEDLYTVSELAKRFDITPRSIRFYETKGLLESRRVARARIYDRRQVGRLKIILRSKQLGFTLSQIKQYFDLYDRYKAKPNEDRHLVVLLRATREQMEKLRRKKVALEESLDGLQDLEQVTLQEFRRRGLDPDEALYKHERCES
jgi:DNA-binding transcriptional MerR regulator